MKLIVSVFLAGLIIISLLPAKSTWADNATKPQVALQPMFNPMNDKTNMYRNSMYNFSMLPPKNWILVSQSNKTDGPLATFSNENPSSKADVVIYYYHGNPISDSITSLPDNVILDEAIQKLFNNTKFTIYEKNIERFSDGFVIQSLFANKQITQKSPINEEFAFWLNDGRQYFLILTTSQQGANENVIDFERSVYSFYVGTPESTKGYSIPSWVKNNAELWSEGRIDDQTFINGIEYLIKNSIITAQFNNSTTGQSSSIPSWIKTNAGWWAKGEISDNEFLKGIQYLISNSIIKI